VNINKKTIVISPGKMNFNEELSCGRIYYEIFIPFSPLLDDLDDLILCGSTSLDHFVIHAAIALKT
jgi:hypothetical protein